MHRIKTEQKFGFACTFIMLYVIINKGYDVFANSRKIAERVGEKSGIL